MIRKDEKNGCYFIEGVAVKELAEQFGTPIYAYSENRIRKNIENLRRAISPCFAKFRIQYPIKANSNPHILRIIQSEGLGADCSSPAEIYIAQKTGFPMNRSTYTGNYESLEDLKTAAETDILINLDDYRRFDDILKFKKPDLISFRINPGIGRGGFEGIVTGGTDAKFGIPYEETRDAYRHALSAGVKRFGIHMMTGSNILEPLYFAEITQKLTTIAGEALEGLGIGLEFINIGGGFGIPYTEEESEMDLHHTFKHIAEMFHDNVKKYRLGNPELVVEPGRFIVGNAGALISQVTHVKHSYRSFVGLDAGMNTLLRPALYKAYHQILIDGKPKSDSAKYLVTGQICENSDIHPLERNFPEPEAGDIAVICDAGAYGYAMSSNYNNRPRPAEVLVSGKSYREIRNRETIEDIFRNVPGF